MFKNKARLATNFHFRARIPVDLTSGVIYKFLCGSAVSPIIMVNVLDTLTLKCIMSQNGQTHFKNLAAFTARLLKCVRPFWDIMH